MEHIQRGADFLAAVSAVIYLLLLLGWEPAQTLAMGMFWLTCAAWPVTGFALLWGMYRLKRDGHRLTFGWLSLLGCRQYLILGALVLNIFVWGPQMEPGMAGPKTCLGTVSFTLLVGALVSMLARGVLARRQQTLTSS